MPKESKTNSKAASVKLRHAPLDNQITSSKKKSEGKFSRADKQKVASDKLDSGDIELKSEFLDAKTSKKIMKQAQEQREELMNDDIENKESNSFNKNMKPAGIGSHLLRTPDSDDSDDEENNKNNQFNEDDDDEDYDDEECEIGSDGYMDIADNMDGMSDAEKSLMGSFFGSGGGSERKTINDLILEKIQEKEAQKAAENDPQYQQQNQQAPKLPPKVIQVYTEIGKILKHYSNGKLPKAFKIIPSLSNWEEVLWITKPDEWSPGAVYAATRIFASNFNERMAQRFYNLILMERVQGDIEKNGRLNYHLYTALRKAVYKPAAFYKGILLPLANGGQCSIKDATVIASVLQKVSVPANHSAAVLLKLTEMPYSGPTSLFIRVLLNKKYALPHRVIDSLVKHFMSFSNDNRSLPVLWHQSLLVFAQRYKHDITAAQKEEMKVLFKNQFHHLMTPEVRRELFSGHSRGEAPSSMRESVGSTME